MKFLTAQEQRVLLVIMFLLLVGWAVKAWREAQPAATAKPRPPAADTGGGDQLEGVAMWVTLLDSVIMAALSPRKDFAKNYRVHPTH